MINSRIQKLGVATASILLFTLSFLSPAAQAIYGGETTSTYPWMIAFIEEGSSPVYERVICSGALLKSNWVITAAHCSLPQATTQVVIGRSNLASISGEKRSIVQHHRHPSYTANDPVQERWDLMLIKLNSPSTLQDIDLASPSEVGSWGQGTDVRTYGYGRYSPNVNHASQYSRRAEFRINTLTSDHHRYIASWEGRNACYGDSGGPSITSTPNGAKQAGVFFAMYTVSNTVCQYGTGTFNSKVGYRNSTASPLWYWIQSKVQ